MYIPLSKSLYFTTVKQLGMNFLIGENQPRCTSGPSSSHRVHAFSQTSLGNLVGGYFRPLICSTIKQTNKQKHTYMLLTMPGAKDMVVNKNT